MDSRFFFSLSKIKAREWSAGKLTCVTSEETPGLAHMAFSSLSLKKNGAQEPIWHPNANKIGYCLQGNSLVSIRSPNGIETFTIQQGDVFFVPQGYVHHIENRGENENHIVFAFNTVNPETMHLTKALRSLSDDVFRTTFDAPKGFLDGLKTSTKHDLLVFLPQAKKPSHPISSRFKFNIADSSKPILTKGGYLQLATKTNLPVLDGLGILGFGLNPNGVVEPHWHTNAGELVFIVKGRTRITVLAPDGKVDHLEVNGGEGAFAPASYFHNIQNVGQEPVEVIAFFSHAEPDYIGIAEVVGACSNELLASIFNVNSTYFDTFKKTEEPLVIVPI